MKTLPNIWAFITGIFPDATAKAASGTGAKDGTEWRTTAVEEFMLGPVQYLLNFVGQTPNGVSETKVASQIVSAYREACATAAKQIISASGALILGKTNHEVEVDLSSGNISISALPVPDFIGQKIHIYGVGSGIGDIAGGTGLYTNGIFFTENTGGVFLTAISATEWRAENGITAVYISGGIDIKQYSTGIIRSILTISESTDTSVGSGWYTKTFSRSLPVGTSSFTVRNFSSISTADTSVPTHARGNRIGDWTSILIYGALHALADAFASTIIAEIGGEY